MQNLIELLQLLHFYCNKDSIMQMLGSYKIGSQKLEKQVIDQLVLEKSTKNCDLKLKNNILCQNSYEMSKYCMLQLLALEKFKDLLK